MNASRNRIGILKVQALILLFIIVLGLFPISAFAAVNDVIVDTEALGQGIVEIAYKSDTPAKVKVIIQKENQKYTYDLLTDGSKQGFPLQMGNGSYKVSVLQNTQGTKYRYLKTEYVTLALEDQKEVYLNSIQIIDRDNEAVANKAEELTQGLTADKDKVKVIYDFIVNNGSYDYEKAATVKTGYIPKAEDTLEIKKGVCYDFSSLFAAMTRSVGIPTKLVKGYADGVNGYHAWNEVNIDGEWIVVDATSDMQRRAAGVEYTMEKSATAFDKILEY